MTGVCDKCPNWMEEVKAVSPLDDPVEWYQWERVEKAVPGKKGKPPKTKKKIQKVVKEGTVDEAISTLHQKLPAFLHHVFVKRKQSRFFEEKMSNLSPDEALVQVDFAENYICTRVVIKMKYRLHTGISSKSLFSQSSSGPAPHVRVMLLFQMKEIMTSSL